MAKCKYCDIQLKWKQPYVKGNRPVELNGKEHDCPKFQKTSSKNSMYNVDIWTVCTPNFTPNYCGRCKNLCELDKNRDNWCIKCDMYPQVTHNSDNFEPDPNIKSLQITNMFDVVAKYRGKSDDAPTNWIHMNDDGTIKNGYKVTPELIKWYEESGKSILTEIHSKIWYKEKIKPI